MKVSILAARRQRAVERITAASGLDLSGSSFPKTPDVAHRELLILEAVADHMEAQTAESASTSITEMTVKDAMAAVEAGEISARDALVLEEARGKQARVSLVAELQKRIAEEGAEAEAAQTEAEDAGGEEE